MTTPRTIDSNTTTTTDENAWFIGTLEPAALSAATERLAAALTAAGIKAGAWNKAGRNRVYLNGLGRDVSAYFELADGDTAGEHPLEGFALRVFTNCNQGRQWKINRCKQVKHEIMTKLVAADLLEDVVEDWREVVL